MSSLYIPSRITTLTASAVLVAALALWSASRPLHGELFWLLAAAACVPLAIALIQKWPIVLLTGLMFVGNFKNTAAQGVTLTDPTMIMLLLCAGALALDVLYALSGIDGWTLRRLFAGQGVTILLVIFFTAVLIASLTYTPDPQYGKLKISRFSTFEILAFFAPLLLLKSSKQLRQFVIASTLLSIGLVAKDALELIHASAGVLQGNTDITHIGDSMFFGVGILITLYHGVARPRLINYAVVAILAAGMIVSVARGPMAALLLTILISAGTVRAGSGTISTKRILIGTAIATIVGMAVLQWLEGLPWAREKVAWKEAEMFSLVSGSPISGGTISERISFNASALEALKERPLLGLGVGGWGLFYSQDVPVRFPHNFVLEVAAEQGLIGFAILLLLLVVLFRSAYRLLEYRELAFLFPVLTFTVIYNMMTGDIENRQLWFCFGIVAAGSRMALNMVNDTNREVCLRAHNYERMRAI